MDPERWSQLERLYHAALELAPGDRAAFLAEACQQDDELRREVEILVAQPVSRDGPLDHPAADLLSDSTATLATGSQLGPYRIDRILGAGGMGKVYKARDTRLNRDVAVKVSSERFGRRFEREALAVAALNHPNICTLHDVGPNYIVMELVEGPTLAERIKQGAFPLEEALRVARQIADALEAAHEKGIVHRDLKPANIKVKPDGAVKVLDFGLATRSGAREGELATATMTVPGTVLGTAAYMSPEQSRGQPVDKRADIWAFGVVLLEMLTGERAFNGKTVSETLAAILTREPDWEQVPPRVQRVLKRCLEKDAARRLRDISGVTLLLEETPEVDAPSRSHFGWLAAALAVISIVLGVLLLRPTRPVVRPFMRLSVDLGPDAVTGEFTTAVISPDGARLVFSAAGPDGKRMLATRWLNETKAELLSGTENGSDPLFSPDGKWIGFFADGKMKKISVQGGASVLLCDAPAARGASWGEDGSIIAALDTHGPISRVPAAGGTPQPLTKLQGNELTHRWPQTLPGNDAALFTLSRSTVAFEDATIAAVSLRTGEIKVLVRGGYFGRYLPTGNASGHLVYLHGGVLFAAAFNPVGLELRGASVPLLDDLAGDPSSGVGQFSFSDASSGSGTLVYRTGKQSAPIWPVLWLDRSGKTEPLIATPGFYVSPRFSPDGQRLALSRNADGKREIFVYDWQRDKMSRLTFGTPPARNPIWSLDGEHILFTFSSAAGFNFGWMRADGAGESQYLLESKNNVLAASFFPDGRRLAYSEADPDTGWDLWTLALDISDPDHPKPGKPELFLRTPTNEYYPAVSPDGRWIAYSSDESGREEVYVRRFPGPSGKWQVSTAGGTQAIWSNSGRELFFQNLDHRIMVTDYEMRDESFVSGKPLLWSNQQLHNVRNPNYALAPDGKRFAIFPELAPAEEKGEVHLTFLLNFFDELRRRVPVGK